MRPVLSMRNGIAMQCALVHAYPGSVRFASSGRSGVLNPIKTYAQQRVEHYMPVVQQRLQQVSAQWNKFTGYTEIQHLKEVVTAKRAYVLTELDLQKLQEAKWHARQVYVGTVVRRTESQRKTNDLLTRRSSWNDADLSEYTRLLHSEHALAKSEEQSHEAFEHAETQVQHGVDELMHAVMRRYHEEHIWSDRVRSASTYASVGLGVLNGALLLTVCVFVLAVLIVEPYKRRRLANALEERYTTAEAETLAHIRGLGDKIDERLASIEQGFEHNEGLSQVVDDVGDRPVALPQWAASIQRYIAHAFARISAVIPIDVETVSTACGLVGGAIITWILTGIFN